MGPEAIHFRVVLFVMHLKAHLLIPATCLALVTGFGFAIGSLAAFGGDAAASDTATDSTSSGMVHVNYDAEPIGRVPTGWTVAVTGEGTAEWRVAAEATATGSGRVLAQTGQLPKPGFALCLRDGSALRDGFVEVRFKTVSGAVDQAAGVVWRARDAANYYVCRANALENNVVLYKVVNGKRTALDIVGRTGGYGVDVNVAPARWQTLRVEFAGPRFRVELDGRELFAVEDATFAGPGKVGLWTKADSVTWFDDFRYGPKAEP